MNTFPISIISSVIEQCEIIDLLIVNAWYNKDILNDIGVRIKTCSAMVKFIEATTLTPDLEYSGHRLLLFLENLSEIVSKLSNESLLINIWNGTFIETNISGLIDKISGTIIDLVPNYILLNKNIGALQKKIDERFLELRKILGKLENPTELMKESVIKEISSVLQCPESAIKGSYHNFNHNFRIKEVEIQKKMDEFIFSKEINSYLFTDSNSKLFWNKYFQTQSYCLWFDFWQAFRLEFLNGFLTESQIEKTKEKIREKVDFLHSAVVLQKFCNDFFENYWNNHANGFLQSNIEDLEWENVSLNLRITSVLGKKLKTGTFYEVSSKGCVLSPFLRFDGISTIGRKQGQVDLWINDSSISGVHGVICYHPKAGFTYTDLGSSGGSFTLIEEPLVLRPGTVFQLGSTSAILVRKCINNEDQINQNLDLIRKQQKSLTLQNEVIDEVSSGQENSKTGEEIAKNIHKNIESSEIPESWQSKNDCFCEEIQGICELEIEFILKGVNKGRCFRFSDKNENITIGSDEFSTIYVKDPFISLLHGTIKYADKGWVYIDSHSSNKSWLCLNSYLPFCSKYPSSPLRLCNNQQIKLGNVDFQVEIIDFS